MKEYVQKVCPSFDKLIESPIKDATKNIIGWHSSAVLLDGNPIGGGTAKTRSKARRIALAELCERSLFQKLSKTSQKNKYLIDDYPSTSGFAFGFEAEATKYRAIAEAVERWAWSKWIDDGYLIERAKADIKNLSSLPQFYLSHFDEVLYFRKTFNLNVANQTIPLQMGISLGIKGDGIFPGSRVGSINEEIWEHSLLEAYRHLKIYENKDISFFGNNIIYKRIDYFGKNKECALRQINQAKIKNWPSPQVRLLKEIKTGNDGYYLWRSLCHDYLPWTSGKENRFVY